MSGGSIIPVLAGSIAAASAAAAAKKRRKEEEKMTKYNSDDLDGWEFKIVRANTRKFKNKEMVEKVRQEEARAGWELIEKFDDYRLRFKRRVEKRSMDAHLEIDPYRSQVSSSNTVIWAVIIGIFLALTGILVLIGGRFGFVREVIGGFTVPGIILGLIVIIGFIVGIMAIAKRDRI